MAYRITENCNGCTACARACPTRAISGERDKLHVIDSELCVECGTCGRICPHDAIDDPQGNRCAPVKRSLWPKPAAVGKRCVSCSQCVDVCPFGCLEMQLPAKSKDLHMLPVLVAPKKCVACGLCVEICPLDYLELQEVQV